MRQIHGGLTVYRLWQRCFFDYTDVRSKTGRASLQPQSPRTVDWNIEEPDAMQMRPVLTSSLAAISPLLLALSGCNTGSTFGRSAPPVAIAPTVVVSVSDLPGSWGLASFHKEEDKDRTEAEARVACRNPYEIGQGANGGVTMYLADQTQPSEVFIKNAPDGRTYIGPAGPPGIQQDRLIVSYENSILTAVWMDQGARERYGTMVFVKCTAPV